MKIVDFLPKCALLSLTLLGASFYTSPLKAEDKIKNRLFEDVEVVQSSGHRGLGTQGIDVNGDIVYLTFFGKTISEIDKEVLKSASNELLYLSLSFAYPVDEDLKLLQKCKKLQALFIGLATAAGDLCKITNKGVAEIGKVKSLRKLYLYSQKVDDSGISHLKNLNKLEILYIASKKVTDKSIDTILSFPHLEEIGLSRTSISKEGISRLKKLRPKIIFIEGLRPN